MDAFTYTSAAQHIVFGANSLSRLGEIADQFSWERIFLCTTPHLRDNGHLGRVQEAAGARLAGVFDSVQPHVPEHQVWEAVELAEACAADAILGLGGGSPLGMAKAVSYEMGRNHVGEPQAAPTAEQVLVPILAIPTTYAGSEMTPVFGVTHKEAGGMTRKVTIRDTRVSPKVALYDPMLTLDLPPELTAATGINALAHCIEAIYSITRNPLSTAAAVRGMRFINCSLLTCYQDGQNLSARTDMQIGAHLGGAALATVSMGLHHGTCHVLGGSAGVAHGEANCIVLPHAIRFNSGALGSQLALAAEALGIERGGQSDAEMAAEMAGQIEELIGSLQMPQRLRDVGVDRGLLPQLAETLLQSIAVQANPKPLSSQAEALHYLEVMW